jgi:hypothetical protein
MTFSEVVASCKLAQSRMEEVHENVARAICGYWHNGQGSAFYAFSSAGYYNREALLLELSACISDGYDLGESADRLALDMLGTYLINRQN